MLEFLISAEDVAAFIFNIFCILHSLFGLLVHIHFPLFRFALLFVQALLEEWIATRAFRDNCLPQVFLKSSIHQ
jgi:hypothetical protein